MEVDVHNESYEMIEVAGKIVLFTPLRIDRTTIPANLYCYDLRETDYEQYQILSIKYKTLPITVAFFLHLKRS